MLVIGVDVGGTGARGALAKSDYATGGDAEGEAKGDDIVATAELAGITDRADAVIALVRDLLAQAHLSEVDAVAMGSTGFQMLGATLMERIPPNVAAQRVVLCSDMLTSYAGALGLAPGVVIAAGTGAVALGSDMRGTWRRVDGWGYLLGDHGGGSWIGRHGMQAALRAADGRPGGSRALYEKVVERFGDPAKLVAEITERVDRTGLMASFVPAVVEAGDPVAQGILAEAGGHLADTALAALPEGAPRVIVTTGNLFQIGGVLWEAFVERLGDVELRSAKGSGVDGALALAKAAVNGQLPQNAPSLALFSA
ncbi:N-acetylglucosamine kinase [Allorhizocola rhizosphaerae]|uniref:N-acetylglucosamine kinase n=1 Tax=Allorhizocola rhizosphaerae TaxID=1872709 RepID=UPI000E3CEF1A|nr:BadF/BadG/BcrA/BcrD ATPase family protein [Allorhizocola rhizosphaerae]